MYKFIFYSLIFIILFSIFIEIFVGNVSFRKNDLNIITFNPKSLFYYLINPIHNNFLWNLTVLQYNFVFMFSLFSFLYYKFEKYF